MQTLRLRASLVIGCTLLTALVGYIDYASGVQVRVFPLYFIAIALAAWKGSRRSAILVALLSTLAWERSNSLVGSHGISTPVWAVNTTMQLVAFVLTAILISEIRARLDREVRDSRTDPLTTLLNSRGFREYAGQLLALAQRTQRPLTLAYIDLDNFKLVNDRHGHAAGDTALKIAADALRSSTRSSDAVGRVGGDEFAVVLPDTGVEGARIALERIRMQIREAMIARQWPVTVSVGAITFARAPEVLEQAVQRADQLMYVVKQEGKDRIRVELDDGTRLSA